MPAPVQLLDLQTLDAVLSRVEAMGVPWRGSRFETYRAEVAAHKAPNRAFIEAYRKDEAKQRTSFEASAQILQLLLSETVWERLDPARLKAALRVIMEGPAIDRGSDDRPRNTLAELVAAAHFADRFDVSLTADAEDVRLEHEVIGQGAVESKRPKALKNMLPNLNEIGRQLRDRAKDGSCLMVWPSSAQIGLRTLRAEHMRLRQSRLPDRAMEDMVGEVASAVLRTVADVACDVVPPAVYAPCCSRARSSFGTRFTCVQSVT